MCPIWTQSLEFQFLQSLHTNISIFRAYLQCPSLSISGSGISGLSQELEEQLFQLVIFEIAAAAVFQTLHHQYLSLTHCSAREWQVYWRGFNSKNGRGGFPAELFRL